MDAIPFQHEQGSPHWITGAGTLLLELALVIAILYLDRHGTITTLLRDWGAWGIVFSIGLMAVISIVPIPGEFLLILNMKLYGVLLGVLCAWAGTVIGAIITFVLAPCRRPADFSGLSPKNAGSRSNCGCNDRAPWDCCLLDSCPFPPPS